MLDDYLSVSDELQQIEEKEDQMARIAEMENAAKKSREVTDRIINESLKAFRLISDKLMI